MIVLGKTYSDRIDKLCAVLRELSGQSPSFDHEIKRDDVFGEPNGQYHGNSRPPRISLKPDVAEIVVAHEILHAILECARFPGWCDKLKSLFPFATAAAQEICHCVLHTVIDRALSNLDYPVIEDRTEKARARHGRLHEIRSTIQDEAGEAGSCIRIACEVAYHTCTYPIEERERSAFIDDAGKLFPKSSKLATLFVRILSGLDAGDRLSVRNTIRLLLQALEGEEVTQHVCRDIRRKGIIGPHYFTRQQLDSSAAQSVELREDAMERAGSPNKFMAVYSRLGGWLNAIVECEPGKDHLDTRKALHQAFRKSLRSLMDHLGRDGYCQIDSRRVREIDDRIGLLLASMA